MGVYKARSFSSLMVEYFPNMHKALGFIPSTAEKKNKTKLKNQVGLLSQTMKIWSQICEAKQAHSLINKRNCTFKNFIWFICWVTNYFVNLVIWS
jgi:hypothetical protein